MVNRKSFRMQTEREIQWTEAVGARLKRNREQQDYAQGEFARIIEVSQPTLSAAEKGNKALPLYPFLRACEVLGKCANSMMGRRGTVRKQS